MKAARLLMVFSSVSPVFVFLALRGGTGVSDRWLIPTCVGILVATNGFLLWRVRLARESKDIRSLSVSRASDHTDQLIAYLFATLLPFYSDTLASLRAAIASFVAIGFVVFVFWYMNLHYLNLIFAIQGLRVFTVYPESEGNRFSGSRPYMLITRRTQVEPNSRVSAYRISDTVYLEVE